MEDTNLENSGEYIFLPGDKIQDSTEEYCVKLGRYIPTECPELYCKDITDCPFRPKETDLNAP